MNSTEHPASHTLADLAAGRLADAEEQAVIAHLVECEPCLAAVDRLWDELLATSGLAVPDLKPEAAERVERDLWRRIHRSDLAGETIRLGTHALLLVLLALLGPFFGKVWGATIRRSAK
jgi:hypothetical protein